MTKTSTTEATRTLDGVEVPAAGTWRLDAGHTELAFIGRHFMLTKVRGRFTGLDGTVRVGPTPEATTVEVTVDVATVDSGDQARDEHLRSADLFNVEEFPTATFASTGVSWKRTSGTLTGDLTIAGRTREISLAVDYLGHVADPWGGQRAIFSARGELNREDFGLTWNLFLETGGVVASKEIKIEVEVELVLDSPALDAASA